MQLVVNTLVLAATYALIACGYVLVYRVSRVLNLAHGELMMLGGYLLLTTASLFAGRPLLAVAVALLLSLGLGLLVYVVLMRHFTGESVLAAVLVTIALGILLRGLAILLWTAQLQYPLVALGWQNPALSLGGGAVISAAGLLTLAAVAVVYGGLLLFLRYTPWGIRMRAAGENPLLAAQRGVALPQVLALAWGLATLSGGLAGMLLACDSGIDGTAVIVGLKAFPVALVGGLDSLSGALVGALLVAAAEVLAIAYLDPLVSDVVPFFVLLAMLLLRPWGLFGRREAFERV
ncbi:MAG: branched-chain amino acid ABC transporter permease [Candidatus Tectimicrobiota bacterium]|nr:MAG: branched-chain amino acid ABC transporter permease [Candidatus Tectomicrobia bacterium]